MGSSCVVDAESGSSGGYLSSLAAVDLEGFQRSGSTAEIVARSASGEQKWYAAFTMPRHEKRISEHCAQRTIESFLPLYQVRHRWKNRRTATVDLPLFPNYVFVRMNTQDRTKVLRVPGILSVVSSGRELLPIPDDYIGALRGGLLAHRIGPHPVVEVGERVSITTGPMAGMEGILVRHKNELRVVLTLEMIGRSVAVEVGTEEISLIHSASSHPPLLPWHQVA